MSIHVVEIQAMRGIVIGIDLSQGPMTGKKEGHQRREGTTAGTGGGGEWYSLGARSVSDAGRDCPQ